MIYLISDTHFDHKNIAIYCSRVADWQEKTIANWRRIVRPDDTVVHLGDFGFGKPSVLRHIRDNLPGRIVIVKGNHDKSRRHLEEIGCNDILDQHGQTIKIDDKDCGEVEFICITRPEEVREPGGSANEHAIAVSHRPYENIFTPYFWGHVHNNPLAFNDQHKLYRFRMIEGRNLCVEMVNYLPVPLPALLHNDKWVSEQWDKYSAWYFNVSGVQDARTRDV